MRLRERRAPRFSLRRFVLNEGEPAAVSGGVYFIRRRVLTLTLTLLLQILLRTIIIPILMLTTRVYFIRSGCAEVLAQSSNGRASRDDAEADAHAAGERAPAIAVLGDGCYFGDVAVVFGEEARATRARARDARAALFADAAVLGREAHALPALARSRSQARSARAACARRRCSSATRSTAATGLRRRSSCRGSRTSVGPSRGPSIGQATWNGCQEACSWSRAARSR